MLVSGGFTGIANNNVIIPIILDTIDVYDPGTGQWSSIPSEARRSFANGLLKLPDGSVLFMGVDEDSSVERATGAAYQLDTSDLSWRRLADPPTARAFPSMVLLRDGRVMVAGGFDANEELSVFAPESTASVDIFDPATNTWQQAAPMIAASGDLWLFLLNDGRVLAIAGEGKDLRDSPVRAQFYDPDSDTWTVADEFGPSYLPTGAVQLSDGRVLVTGAMDRHGAGINTSLSEGRLVFVELADGRRYFGERARDLYPQAKVYDPATDTWTATHGSTGMRSSASLTLLSDGRVLMAGGEDTEEDFSAGYSFDYRLHSTTAVYDPELNFWSPGPDLTERRMDHTATLIPDGRVIFLGGIGLTEVSTGREEVVPISVLEIVEATAIPQIDPASVPPPEARPEPCETVPIPAPSPGLTPASQSLSPTDILGTAHAALDALDSYHSEIRWAIVGVETDSGYSECEARVIDSQAPDRARVDLSRYDARFGDFSYEIIAIGAATHFMDHLSGDWRSGSEWASELLTHLLDPIGHNFIAALQDASIEGRESLNDSDVYRIAGVVSTGEIVGAFETLTSPEEPELPLRVVYWVGVDDSLIRRVSAEGVFEDESLGLLRFSMTIEYSAFGEEIIIEAPEVAATS